MARVNRGLTLVELLVVIVIIGILASLGLSNYSTSMKRARDGKRKTELTQIASALEMYRADKGYYPSSTEGCATYNHINGSDCLSNTLTPTPSYMAKVPKDPLEAGATGGGPCGAGKYGYMYGADTVDPKGETYRLWTHLEQVSGYTTNCDNPYSACLPTPDCFQVQNP